MKKTSTKGFTLIELIVVIAVIGVLAAILVPTIMNYVSKSKIATKNAESKSFFTHIEQVLFDLYDRNYKVNGIIKANSTIIDISGLTVNGYSGNLADEFKIVSENFNNQKNLWACYIVDTSVKAVACSDKSMTYDGGFPKPCPASKDYTVDSSVKIEDLLIYALKPGDKMGNVVAKDWPKKN
jgi:prepilin-type N-terminal cleavage/methylation domain-containing protein